MHIFPGESRDQKKKAKKKKEKKERMNPKFIHRSTAYKIRY